jgi:hypothetical protein
VADDLPDIKISSPIKLEASRKRELQILEHNNFPVCQSIYREKSDRFGFRRRALLIHRTEQFGWDIVIID